jgi:peptidylprolyl isomerase
MTLSSRIISPILLGLAALALLAGCGGTDSSQADKAAAQAREQLKNPPKAQDLTIKAVVVKPSAGEADIKTKPAIAKQSGKPPVDLVVQDLIVGTGAEAKTGDTVDVQYVGVLYANGKEFDTSWKQASGNKPFTFTLGGGQVISGWDQGIVGMKEGGRRRLIIPADLAYGAQGSPPSIPANAALVFDVDLLKVKAAAAK